MAFYWMIWIGFVCSLSALPEAIRRFRRKKEAADVLQIVGTMALAAALLFYTVDMLLKN